MTSFKCFGDHLARGVHDIRCHMMERWWEGCEEKSEHGERVSVKALTAKEGVNCNSMFLSIRAILWLSFVKHWHCGCPEYFCWKAKAMQWAIYWGKSCNLSVFSSIISERPLHGFTGHTGPGPEPAADFLCGPPYDHGHWPPKCVLATISTILSSLVKYV